MRYVLVLLSSLASEFASAGELELPPNQIEAGRGLYLEKCARCHGHDASGGNAPDIQGVILKDVLGSAQGVEMMPRIVLQEAEAEQIAIFLMSLAPDQARIRLGMDR